MWDHTSGTERFTSASSISKAKVKVQPAEGWQRIFFFRTLIGEV